MAGPDLASMLKGGDMPPAPGPDGPPPGDTDDVGGKMPPEQAVKVMDRFKISPDDLPLVAAAVETLMPMMQGGDQGGPPPGADPGGPPPPPPGA